MPAIIEFENAITGTPVSIAFTSDRGTFVRSCVGTWVRALAVVPGDDRAKVNRLMLENNGWCLLESVVWSGSQAHIIADKSDLGANDLADAVAG